MHKTELCWQLDCGEKTAKHSRKNRHMGVPQSCGVGMSEFPTDITTNAEELRPKAEFHQGGRSADSKLSAGVRLED